MTAPRDPQARPDLPPHAAHTGAPPQAPRDTRLDDTATFPATPRGDAARPLDADEKRSVEVTSGPAAGLAGAAAGAAAGLVTLSGGPIAMAVGAVVGALAGGVGGWFTGQAVGEVRYDEAQDAHYRALYEGGVPGDRGFDAVRPAYQLGHVAAHNPEWVGRDFAAVEPDLRRAWDGDLRTQHGADWEAVRPYARDAYGHARSKGAGVRRDLGVIGSAGSAVDPVELDRARGGQPSVERGSPGFVATRDRTQPEMEPPAGAGGAPGAGLGERAETDANTAHHRDPEYH